MTATMVFGAASPADWQTRLMKIAPAPGSDCRRHDQANRARVI
jgi:hypothetical protein